MASLLTKPFVQTEIGLTDRQVVELQTRIMLYPLKHLPDFIEAMKKAEDGSEGEAHFNFGTDSMPKFEIADLSVVQKERLKQLAIQLDPVAAMQNQEVAEMLHLDAKQVAKAGQIWSQYIARVTQEVAANQGISSPELEKLADSARKLKNMDLDKDARTVAKKQFSDALSEIEKVFAEYFFEANYKTEKIKKEFAPKALEVLTASQKAQFMKLCGKIVKR